MKRYAVVVKQGRSKEEFWYPGKSNRDSAFANFVRNRPDAKVTKKEDDRLKLKVQYVDGSSQTFEYVKEEELKVARQKFASNNTISKIERLH